MTRACRCSSKRALRRCQRDAGLPFIRTSVDHGTALDLAGSGRAGIGSLVEAIKLAAALAVGSRSRKPRAA